MSISLLVDFGSLSTFSKSQIRIVRAPIPKQVHTVKATETKSVEQRGINIQHIRKQRRFTILFVKIVELSRSPCYGRSHVPLLQNVPRDGGAVTRYRAQRRKTEEKCTDTVV